MTRLPIFSSSAEDVDAAAEAFRSAERKALIVTTSDLDINHSHVQLQIDLTGSQFPSTPGPLRVIRYGEDRNVFMQIRSDLAADNNLRPEFEQCTHCTAEPGSMATDARRLRKMLQDNSAEYEVLIKQSLRFADAATDPGIRMSQDGTSLGLDMQGNEVLLLEADK